MERFDPVKYINAPNWQKSRLGLKRIRKLMNMLGNPQKQLKFVHIAGTNGKGSTCAYISQILIESGYTTGQFTSPYIYEFAERIRVNNKQISKSDLKKITLQVKEQAEKFAEDDHPTEFELMTAVAFLYFLQKKCDVVVCEVGMGGRLDSTNVLEAEEVVASVITPVALDHTEHLGDTIEKIALEKAGIIKPCVPVISATVHPESSKSIFHVAHKNNCNIRNVNPYVLNANDVDLSKKNLIRTFAYKNYFNLETSMIALYQPYNAALAIETAEELKNNFSNISTDTIKKGIKNTKWPGRFEIIEKNPYVIIDGAHNEQGVYALVYSLKNIFPNRSYTLIMGVLADKDYLSMVKKIAPLATRVFTITPPNPRALSAQDLVKAFSAEGIEATPVEISKAIKTAKKSVSKDDVIICFGSLYSISTL